MVDHGNRGKKASLRDTVNVTVFEPFRNEFNADLWCGLHVTVERSKVPLTKPVTLTAHCKRAYNVVCLVQGVVFISDIDSSVGCISDIDSSVLHLFLFTASAHQRTRVRRGGTKTYSSQWM